MTEKSGFVFTYLMAVVTSLLLLETGFGLFVFAIPLLLFAQRVKNTRSAVGIFVVATVGVLALRIAAFGSLIPENIGLFLVELLFPVMILAECALYTGLRNKSELILRKLVISSRVVAVIGLAFSIYMTSSAGSSSYDGLVASFSLVFEYMEELLGVGVQDMVEYVVDFLLLLCVPMTMLLGGLQIWIAENTVHKTDDSWQMSFAYMKMPAWYIWLFLGFWVLALTLINVQASPRWLFAVAVNAALGLSVHYMMNGISILTALMRRNSATLTSGRVCTIVVLLSLVPVVNVIVFAVLTFVGALETWVKMR